MVNSVVQVIYVFTNFFCLVLSVTEKKVFKSPTMTVDLSISLVNSAYYCFVYFAALL